ncbi:uncharacterized protein LOC128213809 [Mya arenaria]|uniref:uncharacterized protein LOC128213809 n=1 Tax=Mya arenaria TaxID=6604 RepID=UPI0022E3369B|nr:uncharacterized protein LOC128213809 [Mya arenaria]
MFCRKCGELSKESWRYCLHCGTKFTSLQDSCSGKRAYALYDFDARDHEDLSFRKGDVLILKDQNNIKYEGWCYARHNDPKNKNFQAEGYVQLNYVATEDSCSEKRAYALYDFDARDHEDLSFRKGDVLILKDQNNIKYEGWCYARHYDPTHQNFQAEGYVPMNYVALEDKSDDEATTAMSSLDIQDESESEDGPSGAEATTTDAVTQEYEDYKLGSDILDNFDVISDTETEEYKRILKETGYTALCEKLEEPTNGWKKVQMNIAVTGEPRTGKSSFINSIRGLKADDPGAAEVSLFETTMNLRCYPHPDNPNLRIWDLP